MRNTLIICTALIILSACGQLENSNSTVISLSYEQTDIQKQFDTLYNYQQTSMGAYKGFIEQALAICHGDKTDTITQDVFSSMYLNQQTGRYDCITTTVFQFPNGTISATGIFKLTPGDTIAPDHNFPITGGSGVFKDIKGTYTREYRNGVYHVELKYNILQQEGY
ncbi:hypothetical protein [Chitinophaga tropicalis]|uniref:DUF3224 domain-containing protein n=1 Tax=Chitinophaga tropicalis TaxID=2683588 RepID=A0A7K1U4T3_9BACT|nr:hypothetical protein [Chitinophaga tropicalis]MVT09306.1 hypothetical protein [Chitinophaga tropicalis]